MDRRLFPRLAISCPVRLEVKLLGSEFQVSRFDANGVTLNISRGGMMVHVDRRIGHDSACKISIFQAAGLVQPEILRGTVRHSSMAHSGWQVGIEFDSPLEVLRGAE
ncbi:MAG: PilZ domain-containing protein [Acidobacteriota bacterium]